MVKCPHCRRKLRFDPVKGWIHADGENHGQRPAHCRHAPRHRLTGERWATKAERDGQREARPTAGSGW
jgi:hypothetical protein